MSSTSVVQVGRLAAGCCVRVVGRGTMNESRAAHEFAARALGGGAVVIVDLSTCEYLDSTFLGCLVDLHRKFGNPQATSAEFKVVADEVRARLLLTATRLDKVLNLIPEPPAVIGDWLPLQATDAEPRELMQYVLDCHRQLSEIEGPEQPIFRRIVEKLEKDLQKT